jgi:hypothetical protein
LAQATTRKDHMRLREILLIRYNRSTLALKEGNNYRILNPAPRIGGNRKYRCFFAVDCIIEKCFSIDQASSSEQIPSGPSALPVAELTDFPNNMASETARLPLMW